MKKLTLLVLAIAILPAPLLAAKAAPERPGGEKQTADESIDQYMQAVQKEIGDDLKIA